MNLKDLFKKKPKKEEEPTLEEKVDNEVLTYVIDSEVYKKDPEKYKTIMEGLAQSKKAKTDKEKVENEKKAGKKQNLIKIICFGTEILVSSAFLIGGFAFEQNGAMSSRTMQWIHRKFPKVFGKID